MAKSVQTSIRKPISAQAVLRAVASSTAIETGQNIQQLENKLKQPSSKFASLKLAR
ncbi:MULTISPECIES: hypothetical protein [Deefgea]|uniref:hypothetical protein n=1 Tax=Deefgea TaxID=400947 RepID=UPI00194052B1|nr:MULTISPECIES: hypothetical protein [Deefgea]MBM9889503.1 hypothetical protein [Deefgea sp. CFH1-16]